MIKVAIVSSSFPPISKGGVSSAQYGLLLLLRKNENFIAEGFTFADTQMSFNDSELSIHRSGSSRWSTWLIRKFFNLVFRLLDKGKNNYQTADIFSSAIGSLKSVWKIKKFSPDIVIVSDHGAPMLFIEPFVKAKYIWAAHHNPMRFINNPLIGNMSILDARLATALEKKCIDKCYCVVSPSKYMDDFLQESHNLKILSYVIPNVIDLEFLNKIEKKEHSEVTLDEFKVFIPSAGSSIKGERYIYLIMHFITHMVKNKKVVFLLSGDVSDKLVYEVAHQKGIKCIFLGQQKYDLNLAYLKSCNLCISPTLLENFGMSILEAAMLGVPVVTFDVGGNREMISQSLNGYLVDYLNVVDLCNKAVLIINKPLNRNKVIAETKEKYSLPEIEKNFFNVIYDVSNNNF